MALQVLEYSVVVFTYIYIYITSKSPVLLVQLLPVVICTTRTLLENSQNFAAMSFHPRRWLI
jgi:hypothetical protein